MKLLSAILILLVSCSHHRQIRKDHVVSGSCEKEFNKTELSSGQAIWQNVSEASGTGGSYLVTGLAYSTDIIVSFTSGVVGSVVVCSPLIAFSVLASQNAHAAECLFKVGTSIGSSANPGLGPSAQESTSSWKCPNLDPIADGLLRIAKCYSDKGDMELYEKQISNINESSTFQNCLSKNKKREIAKLSKKIGY